MAAAGEREKVAEQKKAEHKKERVSRRQMEEHGILEGIFLTKLFYNTSSRSCSRDNLTRLLINFSQNNLRCAKSITTSIGFHC